MENIKESTQIMVFSILPIGVLLLLNEFGVIDVNAQPIFAITGISITALIFAFGLYVAVAKEGFGTKE